MRQGICRGIGLLCALAVAVNALAFAFAHWVQPWLIGSGINDPSLAWFAFMTRTMTLHAGLYLLGVTAIALFVRAHRTGWAALTLAFVLLGPTLWDARPNSSETVGDTLTIASFNLWSRNPTPDAALDAVLNCGADVICLQEYTPDWHARCEVALAVRYPHRVVDVRSGFYGSAIYSRDSIQGIVRTIPTTDMPMTTASVKIGNHDVVLWNAHLSHQGHGQTDELRGLIWLRDDWPTRSIFLGDFNFTQYAAEHAAFTTTGYRDALDLAGRGLNTTWPRNRRGAWLMYPGVRIDHVYLSPDLTARRAYVADTPGSDHAHVVVEIGFAASGDER